MSDLHREALRVTQAAGLRLSLLPRPGEAAISCPRCGAEWGVDVARWVALPARERGCIRRAYGQCEPRQ